MNCSPLTLPAIDMPSEARFGVPFGFNMRRLTSTTLFTSLTYRRCAIDLMSAGE